VAPAPSHHSRGMAHVAHIILAVAAVSLTSLQLYVQIKTDPLTRARGSASSRIASAVYQAETACSLVECTRRLFRAILLYYVIVATRPIPFATSFYRYSLLSSMDRHGTADTWVCAGTSVCFLCVAWVIPVLGIARAFSIALAMSCKRRRVGASDDLSFLTIFMYLQYTWIASWCAVYFSGAAQYGRQKDYWRNILVSVGAGVAPEIARWSAKDRRVKWLLPCPQDHLVAKQSSGACGIGDACWEYGKDFVDEAGVEQQISEHIRLNVRSGCAHDFLLLQRIFPLPALGVHLFEILTMKEPSGHVSVLLVSFMHGSRDTGCKWSSHNSRYSYLVHPESELILGPNQWFLRPQEWDHDPEAIGQRLPGVRGACATAAKAHQEALLHCPHWRTIGWDCMLTEKGDVVWFEGNVATVRLGRIMCSSWATLQVFVSTL